MTAERRRRISLRRWSCWIPAGTGRIRFAGWRSYDVQWRRWVSLLRAFHPESGRFTACEAFCTDVCETAVNGEDGELAALAKEAAAAALGETGETGETKETGETEKKEPELTEEEKKERDQK